jgi:hypothetical protein
MKNDQLELDIAEQVKFILLPYLQKFHNYHIDASVGEVEIRERVNGKKTSKTLILRAAIDHESKHIFNPNTQLLNS